MKKLFLAFLALGMLLLAACGSAGGQTGSATQAAPPVNGFGTAANHTHSMVILPDSQQTIVLATHYGIFRSQDHGATWQETAAGPNQLMQGLMTYQLTYNLLNPQRLYVLTLPAVVPHSGTLGLYTSGDGGKTWQLSITDASITANTIYTAQGGNDSPSEVYIYLSEQGARGLKVSMDNGAHFAQAGSPLPFGSLVNLLPIPNQPGHLLVYGSSGVASTSDGGRHWQIVKGIQESIFEMTTPGPNQPIYAEGDAGVYVSHDGGQTFKLVFSTHSYNSLTTSSKQSSVLYGKLAVGVYRSINGGQTWTQLPPIQGNMQTLVIDPNNLNQVYLALSFPVKVYHFQAATNTWQSLTPPV